MSPLLAHTLMAPRAPAWPLGAPHPEEAATPGPGLAVPAKSRQPEAEGVPWAHLKSVEGRTLELGMCPLQGFRDNRCPEGTSVGMSPGAPSRPRATPGRSAGTRGAEGEVKMTKRDECRTGDIPRDNEARCPTGRVQKDGGAMTRGPKARESGTHSPRGARGSWQSRNPRSSPRWGAGMGAECSGEGPGHGARSHKTIRSDPAACSGSRSPAHAHTQTHMQPAVLRAAGNSLCLCWVILSPLLFA